MEARSRVVDLDDGRSLLTVFRDLRERRRQEAALRASERRFVAFLEHLPAMGYIKDLDGRYIYANGLFEEVLELEEGSWEGRLTEEVLPPELVPEAREEDRAVLEGRTTLTVTRLVTDEGERVWRTQRFPSATRRVVRLPGGPGVGRHRGGTPPGAGPAAGHGHRQTTDVVIITDARGIIEYVNPAFRTVTGYEPEEAVGSTPRMLQSGEQDEAFYRRLWQTLEAGEAWSGHDVTHVLGLEEWLGRPPPGTLPDGSTATPPTSPWSSPAATRPEEPRM